MKKAIVLFTLCLPFSLRAQEKIFVKTQKAPLEGTITEIGLQEVKYRPADAPQIVVSIDKQELVKIVYQSGRVQSFSDPMQDFNYYKGQKKLIAKAGLLSPLFGYTDLYLEQSQKPGRSMEYMASLIGLGKNCLYERDYDQFRDNDRKMDQKGIAIGVGMKFLRLPDYNSGQLKLRHILQGSYIKPALSLGYYQRNFTAPASPFSPSPDLRTVRKGVIYGNVSVALGRQWILDNTLSIEVYGQIGLGIDNYRQVREKISSDANSPVDYYTSDNAAHTNFGHLKTGRDDLGLTLNAGLKIGYLFNWKKPKEEVNGNRNQ